MTTFLTWLIPPGIVIFFAWIIVWQFKRGKAHFLDWFEVEEGTSPVLFALAQFIWFAIGLFAFLVSLIVVFNA